MALRKRKTRAARASNSRASVSEMSAKLDRLERKIDDLRKEGRKSDKEIEESLEVAEDIEEDVHGLENEIDEIESDLSRVEERVIKISRFSIGRQHLMEFARGAAGAFLGVSVGMGLRLMPRFAEGMSWLNVLFVLVIVFVLGGVLIYKNNKDWIKKESRMVIVNKLLGLFAISLFAVSVSMVLFNLLPSDPETILKSIIVGTYPAMAGAITFTIS